MRTGSEEADAVPPREAEGEVPGEPDSPAWDPFAPLDPNDPGTLPIRPYRKAPRRRGKQKAKQKPAADLGLLAGVYGYRGLGPVHILAFPEFEYALQVGEPDTKTERNARGSSRCVLVAYHMRGCEVEP